MNMSPSVSENDISISDITFEHYSDGFIGHTNPRLSWRYNGSVRNWKQIAVEFRITTRSTCGREDSRTFFVDTPDNVLVPWPARSLNSRESAQVSIRGIGDRISTEWSSTSTVEVSLLHRSDWKAGMIKSEIPQDINATKQPLIFRKELVLTSVEKRARLYITAHGLYEAKINGQRVGDHVLAPGWTSYNHRLTYQSYDVTNLLHEGQNILEVQVGEGWYAGRLGFMGGVRSIYGEQLGLIAQLEGGNCSVLAATDESWSCGVGQIVSSEIYDGEVVDLRKRFSVKGPVRVDPLGPDTQLLAPVSPPVRCTEEVPPINISKSPSGKIIVDFGQNLVGWLRVSLKSFSSDCAGKTIILKHVEVLEKGECGSRPLRLAKAQDSLTLSNSLPGESWEPKFTFHGFRYVQVDGWPVKNGVPSLSDLTAMVVHSDMEETGWFECSNSLVNQLHKNVRWGMRGNFVSVPTDCPQRDERMGWTGDLAVFAPTANFLYNTTGLLSNWFADLSAEQLEQESCIPPAVVPDVLQFAGPRHPLAVWCDVTVTGPWDVYQSSGDVTILREQYESMTAWVDKALPRGPNKLWYPLAHQLGDWLDPSAPPSDPSKSQTDAHLVANAYLVHVTDLLAKISALIGRSDKAVSYSADYQELKGVFQREYITPSGRLASDSQTAHAVAICFDLFVDDQQKAGGAARLDHLVRSNGFKVGTGFAGTPLICKALSSTNQAPLAYRMLLEKKCPSWLYAVAMGSTTMWERWDSMLPDGSLNPGEMLSFNHYAFGAIAQWLHEVVGGISPLEPGWKKILVRPVPGGNMTNASAKHLSPYGMVECAWEITGEAGNQAFQLNISIPPNATATVILPGSEQGFEIGSGRHEFSNPYLVDSRWPPKAIYPPPPFYFPEPDEYA